MHFIPGLRLRASEEAEILGIDDAEMGEFAYDYVSLEQEVNHTITRSTLNGHSGTPEPGHHKEIPDSHEESPDRDEE